MAKNMDSMVDSAKTQESIFDHTSIWEKSWIWCVDNPINQLPVSSELNRCSTPIDGLVVDFSTGRKVNFAPTPEVREYELTCEELLGKRFWNRFHSQWRRFQIQEKRLCPQSDGLSQSELRIKFNNFRRSLPCEICCADYDAGLDFNLSQQLLLSKRFTNLSDKY